MFVYWLNLEIQAILTNVVWRPLAWQGKTEAGQILV